MPTIAGLRGTGKFAPNERPQDFREVILRVNPNGTAPLFALTSKTKKDVTTDPQFHWFEEVILPPRAAVGTLAAGGGITPAGIPAPAAGATTSNIRIVPLQPGTNNPEPAGTPPPFVPGDVIAVESALTSGQAYELMLVLPTAAGAPAGSITVQRGFAGTTPAAVPQPAAGQPPLRLIRVGTSYPEGANAPQSVSQNPVQFFNYTQIFRTTYQVTKTAAQTRYRTGDVLKNERIRRMFQHSASIEFALIFGRPSETIGANGQPQRTTGGLLHFVQSNVTVFAAPGAGAGTPLTVQSFINAVAPVFDFDTPAGDERIVFCGNGALTALNLLVANNPRSFIRYDGIIDVYGMRLQKWVLPQGTLYLKTHPLFNTNPAFTNTMLVIDPTGIIWRPLRGRDTHFRDNIQPPDADYIMGEWLTEGGLELHHERAFAVLHNVVI